VTERPEDEQQADDQDLGVPEEPEAQAPDEPPPAAEEPVAEEPAAPEPVAEAPAAPEPVAEAPAAPEPVAEAPVAPEPVAEAPVAPEPVAEAPAAPEPVAEEPVAPEPIAEAPAGEAPAPSEPIATEPVADDDEIVGEAEVVPTDDTPDVVIQAAQSPIEDDELDDIELTPRQKPEIPGADLIPDIIPEGEQFLDAEAQAAAEADAEALAAREQEEAEEDSRPIADAAIDLAAGARYTATGKRKTAVARVIIKPGTGTYVINGKTLEEFFPRETLTRIIRQPLETVGYESRMDVVARMHGGGVSAQAGALRHGISRALIVADPNLRGELKRRGFLTRDPRVKERKKAGLKKARKRPQFSKR
jgi:small subunit ribosomal protein S9